MPFYNSFRRPGSTRKLSPNFGIPKGTFGRNGHTILAVCLHSLEETLEEYDSKMTDPESRSRAQTVHPSLHYVVGYDGAVHQYVDEADIAWGLWDYDRRAFPSPYPPGTWSVPALHPGIPPDAYVLHIGTAAGPDSAPVPFPDVMIHQTARLIAYLFYTYALVFSNLALVTHDQVDAQFVGKCVPADFPYLAIYRAAYDLIAAHGEPPDDEFDRINLREYIGPFTVGLSRISSAAYISPD